MAYSNWGAFVWKNGERQKNREDVPVFGDADVESAPSGMRIFVNILKERAKTGNSEGEWSKPWDHCQHAVLGGGSVRLCGYKSYPKIFVVRGDLVEYPDVENFRINNSIPASEWEWYDSEGIEGEIDGHKFKAWPSDDPEAVNLELTEPDGTVWTGKSGLYMGAGYED